MASSTCEARCSRLAPTAVVVLLAARAAAAVPVPAPDDSGAKSAAQAKLVEGVQLLKDRRYPEALARFQQAYAAVPSPLIAYDFGLAYLGLGDDARALESFDTFLGRASDAPLEKRHKAERYRDELRARVSVVELGADVGQAEVAVDGSPLGQLTFPRRLYLRPGSHEVVARADGATQAATVTCVAGQTVSLVVRLDRRPPDAGATAGGTSAGGAAVRLARPDVEQPRPSDTIEALRPPPRPAAPSSRARAWGLSATVAGVVSLGVGVVFGVLATDNGAAVTGESRDHTTFMPDFEAAGVRDQRLETVFLSIGAAAVIAGIGLYAIGRSHPGGGTPPLGAP